MPLAEARAGWLAGVGAFLAAFAANAHHSLHMLLISLGIGASSFLVSSGARRVMLGLSLAMTALFAWWALRRPHRSTAHTAGVVAAIAASLALVVLSVVRDGV